MHARQHSKQQLAYNDVVTYSLYSFILLLLRLELLACVDYAFEV